MFRHLVIALPFVFLAIEFFFNPLMNSGFTRSSSFTLIMMAWMVLWWIFEVLPLGITALIPMIFLPLTQVMELNEVTSNYANPVIYLFLGGFMLARGLEKTGLNERIALQILSVTGRSDKGIVIGFIVATAFLSMWVSNTATTVMMLPIAISVIEFLRQHVSAEEKSYLHPFSVVVYLSIAYAANIGGVVTPIGTPPNVVFVGYLEKLYQTTIDFYRWIAVLLPVALIVLFAQFVILNKLFSYKIRVGAEFRKFVREKLKSLGPMVEDQRLMLILFAGTCSLWVFKDLIHFLISHKFLNDTSIAILGGVLLFVMPASKKTWKPILDHKDIPTLPWNIVLLFGGGIALANSLEKAGLIQSMTNYFVQWEMGSSYLLVFVLALVVLALTEIMSNVALCVVALPVLMQIGVSQGIDPIAIGLPAAIASSMAFTMPISTPPNAIVFGTGVIRISDMLKAGILLNLIGLLTIMSVGWYLAKWLL